MKLNLIDEIPAIKIKDNSNKSFRLLSKWCSLFLPPGKWYIKKTKRRFFISAADCSHVLFIPDHFLIFNGVSFNLLDTIEPYHVEVNPDEYEYDEYDKLKNVVFCIYENGDIKCIIGEYNPNEAFNILFGHGKPVIFSGTITVDLDKFEELKDNKNIEIMFSTQDSYENLKESNAEVIKKIVECVKDTI